MRLRTGGAEAYSSFPIMLSRSEAQRSCSPPRLFNSVVAAVSLALWDAVVQCVGAGVNQRLMWAVAG